MVELVDRFILWHGSLSSLKIAKRTIAHEDSVAAGVKRLSIYECGGKATKRDTERPVTWRHASTQTEDLGANSLDGVKRTKRMSEGRRQYKRDYNKRLRASKKAVKAKDGHGQFEENTSAMVTLLDFELLSFLYFTTEFLGATECSYR